MRIEAHPRSRAKPALTASMQMLRKPSTDIRIDRAKRMTRIAVTEVVRPAAQVPVQTPDEFRLRDITHAMIGHLMDACPGSFQRLVRYRHVQVPMPTTQQVALGT